MEVILNKYVKNLGGSNDIVAVKPGYARNFLIPRGLAMVANDTNKRIREERLKVKARKEDKMQARYAEISKQLAEATVKVGAKVGSSDKIFGSVTNYQLADAIQNQLGIDIDRKKISIAEGDVKSLGTYTLNIDLHKDHQVQCKLEVVAE